MSHAIHDSDEALLAQNGITVDRDVRDANGDACDRINVSDGVMIFSVMAQRGVNVPQALYLVRAFRDGHFRGVLRGDGCAKQRIRAAIGL